MSFPTLPADLGLAPDANQSYYDSRVALVDVIGFDRMAALGHTDPGLTFEALAADHSISGVATSTFFLP